MTNLPRTRVRVSRKGIPRPLSPLVEMLKVFLRDAGLPAPLQEFQFHSKRLWRFDLCYPDKLLAIECEGGIHTGGRHVRGKGYEQDCEKYNEAQLHGWTVLRFTMGMINDGRAIAQIRRAYEQGSRASHGRDREGNPSR